MTSRFLYVTYIRAPAEKVFAALTDPAQNRLFWGGYHQESNWAVGADFAIVGPEGQAWDEGKVVAFDPPRHFEVTWLHLHDEAMKAEGVSTCSFDLEQMGSTTKLTITHVSPVADSKLIGAVSTRWPMICLQPEEPPGNRPAARRLDPRDSVALRAGFSAAPSQGNGQSSRTARRTAARSGCAEGWVRD